MFWTPRVPRSEYTIRLRGSEEYHFKKIEIYFFCHQILIKIVSECNIYNIYMENVVLSYDRLKKKNKMNIIDYEIKDNKTMKKSDKWLFHLI